MGASRKIERPRQVSDLVIERLREDIVTDVFALGEKLSETQLAETYGVTKAPVRAAYTRLQSEGLLDIRAQSGTYVFKPTKDDLRSLCELRVALELEAVRLALQRAPEALEVQIASHCQQMREALEQAQQRRYQTLDTSFHMVFFDIAQSPCLFETYESRISSAFAALRHRFALDATHNSASIQEHEQIRAMIAGRDLGGLHAVLRQHIQNTEVYYEKILGAA